MNFSIDQLAKSILQKDTLDQCSVNELQHLTEQYPFFSAAHLLLARKLSAEAHNNLYKQQLQKTSLYFYNPLWLEYLLNNTEDHKIVTTEPLSQDQTNFEIKPETDNKEETRTDDISQPEIIANEMVVEPASLSEEKVENTYIDEPEINDEPIEEIIQEESISPVELPTVKIEPESDDNEQGIIEDTSQPEIVPTEVMIQADSLSEEKEKNINIEQPEINDDFAEEAIHEEAGPSVELPAFKIEPIDPANAELIFRPYHTVDYFASLGIKFKEEEKPKDKFGQQLKSFTEWLKTLKGTAPSETNQSTNTTVEQKIEQLADQSLESRDVITETMAEVWEKQGNTAKAIDIYNKLSLLDPSKRGYFATKIEELKKTN